MRQVFSARRSRPAMGVLLCLVLWMYGEVAAAQDSSLADGVRAYRARDYTTARDLFLAASSAHPDSGATLFNLGLAHYQLRDYAAARRVFLDLRRFPDLTAIAEYHLGLVAARTGQAVRASAHFRAAAAGGSSELRRLAQAALEMLSDTPVAQVPAAYLMFASGVDDNRNRLAEHIEIPGRDAESAYTELYGLLQYPLRRLEETDLRATVFQRDYSTDDVLDQSALQLNLRRTWRLRPWTFTAAAESEAIRLEGRGNLGSLGLGLLAVRREGGMALRLRYQPAWVQAESEIDYLDGRRQRFEVSHEVQLGGLLLAGGYDIEANDQARRGLDDTSGTQPPLRHGPSLRLSRSLTPRFSVELNASLRRGIYEDIDPAFRFDERRVDDLLYLGCALRYRVGRSWGLRLDYRYSDNRSSLDLFDYQRQMAQFGLDWRY